MSIFTWRPGFYYASMHGSQDFGGYLSTMIAEIAATPAIMGGQWRFWLNELITGPGQYDWTNMDLLLDAFTAINKPVLVMFQCRSFNLTDHPSPSYMRNNPGIYGTVEYKYGASDGYNIYWPSATVQAEMAAFAAAFGARYINHQYLEGAMVSETSKGTPSPGELTAGEEAALTAGDGYVNGMGTFVLALRTALPNKQIFHYCNSTRAELETYIPDTLLSNGCSLAVTDVFIDNENSVAPSLNYQTSPFGIYKFFRNYKNVVSGINQIPLAAHLQPDSYVFTKKGNEGTEPLLSDVLAFAKDKLGANYILCTRSTATATALSPSKYYEVLLTELANSSYLGQPWAGCKDALPLSKL